MSSLGWIVLSVSITVAAIAVVGYLLWRPYRVVRNERSLARARACTDASLVSYCLLIMGKVAWYQGDHERARCFYEESSIAGRQTGDAVRMSTPLMRLGRLLRKKRYKEGAIAFDQPEVKFKLDEKGRPLSWAWRIHAFV